MSKLNRAIHVRLGDLESQLKKQAATETNGNISRMIRRAIAAYLEDVPKLGDITGLRADLQKIREDLGRVGGNLNQVAHAFNYSNNLDETSLPHIVNELRHVFRVLSLRQKEILDAIRRL